MGHDSLIMFPPRNSCTFRRNQIKHNLSIWMKIVMKLRFWRKKIDLVLRRRNGLQILNDSNVWVDIDTFRIDCIISEIFGWSKNEFVFYLNNSLAFCFLKRIINEINQSPTYEADHKPNLTVSQFQNFAATFCSRFL